MKMERLTWTLPEQTPDRRPALSRLTECGGIFLQWLPAPRFIGDKDALGFAGVPDRLSAKAMNRALLTTRRMVPYGMEPRQEAEGSSLGRSA